MGERNRPGASILEIGCADGVCSARVVAAGYRATGLDFSPRMIEATRRRLTAAGLTAELVLADLNFWQPSHPYDAVVALMWEFFTYVSHPAPVLGRVAAATQRKLLVDLDSRSTDRRAPMRCLRSAGFDRVSWRPFFVSQRVQLGRGASAAMRALESVRLVRSIPLRYKFVVVLKGEKVVS